MSEYVIETENLTKKYKNQIVVDRLNLHVQKGKFEDFGKTAWKASERYGRKCTFHHEFR